MPEEYRARAFDLAFEQLKGSVATKVTLAPASTVEPALAVTPIAQGGLTALAREPRSGAARAVTRLGDRRGRQTVSHRPCRVAEEC